MAPQEGLVTYPQRSGWMGAVAGQLRQHKPQAVVVSGSIVMLLSTTLVSATNFAFTISMARLLGPARFGHVTAANTLLMLASAITLAFQLVCAKFVARNDAPAERVGIYRALRNKAWMVSLALGTALFAAQIPVAIYLRLPHHWIIAALSFGIAVYAPLGVRRGAMQGVCSFGKLSANMIIEAMVKLVAAIVLVEWGYGVMGAAGGISASIMAAYVIPRLPVQFRTAPQELRQPASFQEGMQAIVFFVGQVIINNIDIILVKHYFSPEAAGLYAAVALVGRVLYFASWSVVSVMFPVSAAAKPREEDPGVILLPFLLVLAICIAFMIGIGFFPELIIKTIFGSSYADSQSLLMLYAAATGLYALGVVLMTYEMSRRIANTGWLQLAFSGVLVIAIGVFHSTLQQVIVVQIVLMAIMLVLVSVPFLRRYRQVRTAQGAA